MSKEIEVPQTRKPDKKSAEVRAIKVETIIEMRNLNETVANGIRNQHLYEAYQTQEWRLLGYGTFEQYCLEKFNLHKSQVYQIIANIDSFGIDLVKRFIEIGISGRYLRKARALPKPDLQELIASVDLAHASKKQIAALIDDLEERNYESDKENALLEKKLKEAKNQIHTLQKNGPPVKKKDDDLTELDMTVFQALKALGYIQVNQNYTDEEMTEERLSTCINNLRNAYRTAEDFLRLKLQIAQNAKRDSSHGKNS